MPRPLVSRAPVVSPAPIDPSHLYPIGVLRGRTGLGNAALRRMRRDGLSVHYVCGRAFVRGQDFIDFIEQHGKSTKDGK